MRKLRSHKPSAIANKTSGFRPNFVRQVIATQQRHFRVYGGGGLSHPDSGGFEGVGLGYPAPQRELLVQEIVRCLSTYRYNWKLAMLVFYIKDGKKEMGLHEYQFDNFSSRDLDMTAGKLLNVLWHTYPLNERIYTGWVAAPDADVDFVAEYDTLFDFFDRHRSWDVDHISSLNTLKELSKTA